MKMIKNILFEVLPIASYTFFPPVWQLVDATPKNCRSFEQTCAFPVTGIVFNLYRLNDLSLFLVKC